MSILDKLTAKYSNGGLMKNAGEKPKEEEDTTKPKNPPDIKMASDNVVEGLRKFASELDDVLIENENSVVEAVGAPSKNETSDVHEHEETTEAKPSTVTDNTDGVVEPMDTSKKAAEEDDDTTKPKNPPDRSASSTEDESSEEVVTKVDEKDSDEKKPEESAEEDTTPPKNPPEKSNAAEEDDTTPPKNPPEKSASEAGGEEEEDDTTKPKNPPDFKMASIILSGANLNYGIKLAEAKAFNEEIDKNYKFASVMYKESGVLSNPWVKNIAVGGIGSAVGAGVVANHFANKTNQLAENTLAYLANDDMIDTLEKQEAYQNGLIDGQYSTSIEGVHAPKTEV